MLAFIKKILRKTLNFTAHFLRRKTNPVSWHNLRNLEPVSRIFGLDRGTPVDRIYQEDFLRKNAAYIQGEVCEIAENTYTKKFGTNVTTAHILHYNNENGNATIIGDLTRHNTLPQGAIDCFICTVTLNFIYDYKAAIRGIYYMLKNNNGGGNQDKITHGVALVTLAALCPVSEYDYIRWGDFWRFTDMGIKRDFEEVFGVGNVEVLSYGNALSATAEIQGISAEELTREELFYSDKNYPVIICVKAFKR